MSEIEIPLPPQTAAPAVPRAVEAACAAERLTLKDTLRAYPGCVHWHYKRGRQAGTLEIACWPSQQRAWFKVAATRRGEWIEATSARLQRQINHHLTGT